MKEKRPHKTVLSMANALVDRLRPACERIEIAGSLRRQRQMVGDIELVALPRPIMNLLGEPSQQTELDVLLASWPVTLTKNGPKYKQFRIKSTSGAEYQVDLFLPDPACWGVVYMIRTGSSDFSRRMVTARSMGGYRPDHLRVADGRVWEGQKALDVPEERDLFDLWGMEYVEPDLRELVTA